MPYIPVLKAVPVSANCSMLQSLVLCTIECSATDTSLPWHHRQQDSTMLTKEFYKMSILSRSSYNMKHSNCVVHGKRS